MTIFGTAVAQSDVYAVLGAVGFLALDMVAGMFLAWRNHVFSWSLAPRQFYTLIAPVAAGGGVISVFEGSLNGRPLGGALVVFIVGAAGVISAGAISDIKAKLAAFNTPQATQTVTTTSSSGAAVTRTAAVPLPTKP